MSSIPDLDSARPRVPVLWLYGPDAVGKSTIAWEIYSLLTSAHGVPAAYVDTDYLGFCTPQFDDRARLVELNLAAMWPNFAKAGARCLIVSGIIVTEEHRRRFEEAIPQAQLMLALLRATPDTLRKRIVARAEAEATTAGRQLSQRALKGLADYGDSSVKFAELLDTTSDIADFSVDTDSASPSDLAKLILQHPQVNQCLTTLNEKSASGEKDGSRA